MAHLLRVKMKDLLLFATQTRKLQNCLDGFNSVTALFPVSHVDD